MANDLTKLKVIVKLEDEAQIPYDSTALPIYSGATTVCRSRGRVNRLTKNYKCGSYINRYERNLEVCSYCYIQKNNKLIC